MRQGSIVVAIAIVASSLSVSCATGTHVGKNAERAIRGQPLDTSGFDRAVKSDAKQFAREVNRAGYATDPSYASKLIGLMDRYDLYRYDNV